MVYITYVAVRGRGGRVENTGGGQLFVIAVVALNGGQRTGQARRQSVKALLMPGVPAMAICYPVTLHIGRILPYFGLLQNWRGHLLHRELVRHLGLLVLG